MRVRKSERNSCAAAWSGEGIAEGFVSVIAKVPTVTRRDVLHAVSRYSCNMTLCRRKVAFTKLVRVHRLCHRSRRKSGDQGATEKNAPHEVPSTAPNPGRTCIFPSGGYRAAR